LDACENAAGGNAGLLSARVTLVVVPSIVRIAQMLEQFAIHFNFAYPAEHDQRDKNTVIIDP
jgi:hypothetical protein